LFFTSILGYSQDPEQKEEQGIEKVNPLESGFYPIWIFDIDLRSVIKYNDHEGLRVGVGGITNDKLFKKYKFGGYFAYGLNDHESKYSIGASIRLYKSD
jgi:hypothetical protein